MVFIKEKALYQDDCSLQCHLWLRWKWGVPAARWGLHPQGEEGRYTIQGTCAGVSRENGQDV